MNSGDNGSRDLDTLWRNYKMLNDKNARDQLIVHYAPLVKYVAGRVAMNLPKNVDEGDLIGYGSLGLLDAMDRFDLQRGVKFETYAIARIRGAMIDGLRSMDWVPVSVRQRNKAIEEATKNLENRLGRSATDDEIANELNMSIEEYNQRILDMSSSSILSFDDIWGSLYYYEGLTVKEIAEILGVSPSRISQLHTKAVVRLRGSLSSDGSLR